MTTGILNTDLPMSTKASGPQFDPAIKPSLVVGIAVVMALLLIAFFIYGQVAPGA